MTARFLLLEDARGYYMARSTPKLMYLESRLAPALATWDGGGADNHWSTAANWVGDVAPNPGDDLILPTGAGQLTNVNDFAAGTAFNTLAVTGAGYLISGNACTATTGINANIPAGLGSTLAISLGGAGGLTKNGTGTLALSGANSYAGLTTVNAGTLDVRSGAALGAAGAGNETMIVAGAVLSLSENGINVPEPISFGAGAGGVASIVTTQGANVTFSGPLTLTDDALISANSQVTVTASVSGAHNLTLFAAFSNPSDAGYIFAPGSVLSNTSVTVESHVAFNGTGSATVLAPDGLFVSTTAGSGSIGPLIATRTRVSPGAETSDFTSLGVVGTLSTGGLTFSDDPFNQNLNALQIDLTGSGTDRVNVAGTVRVGGMLFLRVSGGFNPGPNDHIRLIDNDGADAVVGTFSGVSSPGTASGAEGTVVYSSGGVDLRLTYHGGDGNDVELVAGPTMDSRRFAVAAGPGGVPVVNVYDGAGTLLRQFFAYETSFRGGVNVATADMNGDGVPDIITAPGFGGGPVIRIWDGQTGALLRQFLAYDVNFRGGVSLSVGSLNGDFVPDIITGAGPGGGPHVKGFDGALGTEMLSFFAYAANFTGGVSVAGGDPTIHTQMTTTPGTIITGAGPGGGPHVRIFNNITGAPNGPGFFAYETTFTGGINVGYNPLLQQIVTAPKAGGGPLVRGFTTAGALNFQYLAYDASFRGGVSLAVLPIDAIIGNAIVTGPGPGGGPHVRVWNANGTMLQREFFAFDPTFTGGIYVG
jgi:autotransporter-associated beta strand protein